MKVIFQVLLAKNFYAHFGLDNMFENNEYDADIMLEYDENETYKEFEEFFCDVLTEFEKFGKIVQFKVGTAMCSVYNFTPAALLWIVVSVKLFIELIALSTL